MIGKELIIYSLRNLWKRKSRSFFTILSIFMGIATIFIFISFGLGLYAYVEETIGETATDKILIQPKGAGAVGLSETFVLTDDDLEAVEKSPGVYEATGVYVKPAEVTQRGTKKYVFLIAYDPKKPLVIELSNIDIEKGRNLKRDDEGKVVLGYNYMIKDRIFPEAYELNDVIEVQGKKLRIVGFYSEVGSPQDDSNIYIISDFVDELYPDENNSYSWIIARVDTKRIEETISNVEKNLRKTRDLEKGKEDFFVQSFEEMIESYLNILNIIIGFVILIALISVMVSAINTSNTMVTSVLERTKEIGTMKAIGAKNSDIFKIFLFESGFLGLIGGIIGIFLGLVLSLIGGFVLDKLGWGFLQPSFPFYLFLGSVLFAIFTGAISGVMPALQASKLKPAETLRYE